MKLELKLVLILVAASVALKAIIAFAGVQIPEWVAWLSFAIWVPIFVWIFIKIPGWHRRNKSQKDAAIKQALLTNDSRANTVSQLDGKK
jgi:hypothetical protein